MKTGFIFVFLLGSSLLCSAQDAMEILRKSSGACRSVMTGHYEMTRRMKYMSGPDTSSNTQVCHFRKLPEDTLFQAAFHYTIPLDSMRLFHVLYTGEEFVTYSEKDSTGRIMVRSMWAQDIGDRKHNYDLYDPLIRRNGSPLPDSAELSDSAISIQYLGTENLRGAACYHIQVNEVPLNEPEEPIQTLRVEYHYWIDTANLIPVSYSTAFDMVMNQDTMSQYEIVQLDRYTLHALSDTSVLTLGSIPAHITLKDYVPYAAPELLPVDTLAPAWTLPSMDGQEIRLEDLKGKVVLIDFFYKACYPCMLALPGLQALHETYAGRGLVVIGLNPFDTQDQLQDFLMKLGVTYPIVLEGKQAAKDYRISGYPTIYILDQEGRIAFAESGYGEGKEKEYENIITSLLK